MLIITDNDLVEGVIGVLSLVISVLLLQNVFHINNLLFIVIIFWCILWFLRKIGINLYKEYKNQHEHEDKEFKLENFEISKNKLLIISGVILLLVLFISSKDIHSLNLRNMFSLNIYEILLVCIIVAVCYYFLNNKTNNTVNLNNNVNNTQTNSKDNNNKNNNKKNTVNNTEVIPEANKTDNLNSINNIKNINVLDENDELNKLVNDGQNLNTEFIIKYFKDDVCLENNNLNKNTIQINNKVKNNDVIDYYNSAKQYVKQKINSLKDHNGNVNKGHYYI